MNKTPEHFHINHRYLYTNKPYSQFLQQCQPTAIPQCVYACVSTAQPKHTLPLRVIGRELPSHLSNINSTLKISNQPLHPNLFQTSLLPQILLDQIFPADYSQFTQSTFFTPAGLNSTAQKPYSVIQNLPPQELGMIISAILSLRYNIHHRASRILNPALNLLIKFSILSSGGPPTSAFHIPQDLSTKFEHLQLEPVIQNCICFPQCFFLNNITESVTTDQPHCQCHNDPNDHDPPCIQSLGKFIDSFEPCTQNITNMKKKFIPTKLFSYQKFKNWLARFLQQAGIMEILHQHQQS
ncbi:hypothetical protein O181_032562 [Austropuccinia psidii MF-1]|uniref:Uncharacterized protein n=1 Tax=Austropuccinia psidii MF-1 TaxID=1389203 RepID=A0A9Q3CZQ1_9BASI|nr:hypothetical protein [Austropuccinia psidii MF-1]